MAVAENGSTGRSVAPIKLMRNNSAGQEQGEKELEWLFHPSPEWDSREGSIEGGSPEETKVLVGEYFYWVRVSREIPELCRTGRHCGNLVHHEVLNHQNFGITDDDIDEIIRHTCYPFMPEYRVSDRVKTKLQALHE
ncbi:MAG: hypothetical protein LUQ40_06540 [Methanomicrobiales archaeon]|nr:hypothetical protein [Methanomicrobiales archaeon]